MRYSQNIFWAIALLLTSYVGSYACDQKVGNRVAVEVTRRVNILADFTTVQCVATNDAGRCGLVCLTVNRISDSQRHFLLIVLTGSSGLVMRQAGLSKFSDVAFMDKKLGENRLAAKISAARASQLQEQVKADKITFDQFREAIRTEFKIKTIPK